MDKENSRYEELTSHFEKDISKEIEEFAIEKAFKYSRYIFTHKDKKQQFGFCTHCGAEFKTGGLKHNEGTTCPKCKSKVMVRSSGMGRKYMIDNVYFVYYQKSVKDPNIITARGIQAQRDYRYGYHNIITQYFLMAMYVFDASKGESTMLKHSYYGNGFERTSSICSLSGQYEQRGARVGYSRESIEIAVKDTPFKYSQWDSYYSGDMTKFFEFYTKYPCVEYLTKEGYKGLVQNKLNGGLTYRTINWRGKTIFKILKINKQDLKLIKAQKINVTFTFLKVFQDARKHDWKISIEETLSIAEDYLNYYDSLLNALKYSSMKKLLNYFSKQFNDYNLYKTGHHYYNKGGVLGTFRDYISDCIKLGIDTTKDQAVFPKNLFIAHQNTIKQIKMQKDEKLDALIKNRVKLLKKYLFKCNGLVIRPAESSEELIKEGAALTHCVGGYADRYAKGETNIFFIRKDLDLNKPYYTIEIKKDKIIQVHGKNNRSPSVDVQEFIKAFTNKKLTKKKAIAQKRITIPA
ncbi:PcfJ domain-containing protein [Clostridium lacusfryxellense]|uniref:PcfJ domain-containing protein n=1 Tax=Clostridium lacusfryxellense TaxID=205328 RepID=UPI001C0C0302|nr:PcfJ domain-containing protein [Clostridium lacusfryxellense]MBU3111971.1 PcfJ domain-containing protein [Clostridium lacusfryxellense]